MRSITIVLTLLATISAAWAAPEAQPVPTDVPDYMLPADRPNVLWITVEDMSPTLFFEGDKFANTPNLDKLYTQSIRYSNAFATAPVCSPSRSCLINGAYAQSQGTHNMRSAFPIPGHMTGFPSILREAGYYTTNNVKTDYNSANWDKIIKASWDESSDKAHWRGNPDKGKPFFAVFNLMTTHQSRTMVWPYEKFVSEVQSKLKPEQIHKPERVKLPPYYPDTPVVRKTVARYYDCVTVMDQQVGAILDQLIEDGLAADTIVFFYSDHGSGMPRHKRALLDSGMKVPLLVRFPARWMHLAPAHHGKTDDRLVSFVDFGPTVLSLLGMDVPEWMQGEPFLGASATEPREYVYGHRDRVDEVIDMARSVRDKRYLYIRNFMPHLSYNQPTAWPDLGEIRHEIYRLADKEKMTSPQWHFAGPRKPIEELYDCVTDPENLNNLVASSEHAEVLHRMRAALEHHLETTPDLGFMPEAIQWERAKEYDATPWEIGKALPDATRSSTPKATMGYNQVRAIDTAQMVRTQRAVDLERRLTDRDPVVRYWAAVALNARETLPSRSVNALTEALSDDSVTVRIEAASALARHGHTDASVPVLVKALEHENLAAVLHAARSIELLGDKAASAESAMRKLDTRVQGMQPKNVPPTVVQSGDVDMAMFIGFSTKAFLNRK